jgi:hypothetical protein
MSTIAPVPSHWPPLPDGRAAGIILATCSIVMVVVLTHHPHVAAAAPDAVIAGIGAVATSARRVHGAVIALECALLLAFVDVSCALGLRHLAVRAALLAAAVGTVAFIGAALLDGFVLPELALRYRAAPVVAQEMFPYVAAVCGTGLVVLTMFGLVATCFAMILWSLRLLRTTRLGAVVGALGLVVGPALVVALATDALQLRASQMAWIMAIDSVWNLALAGVILRGVGRSPT